MKILVTGGAGFIGSHLVDALVAQGHEVAVYDNLSSGSMNFLEQSKDKINFIQKDLTEDKQLTENLKDIDHVYHVAASPDVRIGADNTWISFEQNILATYNLLEAMRKAGTKGITFTSTSTVYGKAKVLPTPEDYGPLIPISQYGASKLAAEALISAFSDNFGIRATCLRFANVIGSRATHGILIDFIKKLKKNPKELEILGDGTQRKSYIHVSDCVQAVIHAAENQKTRFEYYNVGTENSTQVTEIANIVTEAMGLKDVKYNYTSGHKGAGWKGDIKVMSLDVNKLKSTGWTYKYNSRQSLEKAVRELLAELS